MQSGLGRADSPSSAAVNALTLPWADASVLLSLDPQCYIHRVSGCRKCSVSSGMRKVLLSESRAGGRLRPIGPICSGGQIECELFDITSRHYLVGPLGSALPVVEV